VCESTRKGMKQREMQKIAEFIDRVVNLRERPQKIKEEVAKFAAEFQEVKFCFE